MSVIKFIRDIARYFKYPSDDNPTTQQDYQNAVKNWVATETSLVDTILWQPTTRYRVGNVVKTPSIPSQYCLICTKSGTSGSTEPDYTDIEIGDTVTDGTVTWKVDGVLTLSGGTMTGTIKADVTSIISRSVNNSFLQINGGTAQANGSWLRLNGAENASVGFALHAVDANNDVSLFGKPNGILTWGENKILCVTKNIQAGSISVTVNANSNNDVSVTFADSFDSVPLIFCTPQTGVAGIFATANATKSNATIRVNNVSATQRTITIAWIAVLL